MSRFGEAFKTHQSLVELAAIEKLLKGPLGRKYPRDVTDELDCVALSIQVLGRVIRSAEVEIFPLQILSQIETPLIQAKSHLANFAQSGALVEIQNTNNQLANVKNLFGGALALVGRKRNFADIGVAEFERRSDKLIESMREAEADSKAILEDIENLSNEVDAGLKDSVDAISKSKAEVSKLLQDWTDVLKDFRSKQTKKFEEALKEYERNAQVAIEEVEAVAEEAARVAKQSFEEKLDEILRDAMLKHEKILEIYGLVGKDSVSGGFIERSQDERKRADRWRGGSIAFILLAISWLGLYYYANDLVVDWGTAFGSFPMTLIILLGAGYSGNQSARHRGNENRYQQFALETAAIDPYLQSLPVEQAQQIKRDLTPSYFGHVEANGNGDAGILDTVVKDRVQQISESVENLKAAATGNSAD